MAVLAKRPIQIYLEERQDRALRRIAEEKGISLSELIRRSIDLYLENLPVEDDPALKIVGLGRSGLGDLAERHDEYLTRWEKETNQP
jgi:16S rRNA U516 pseudouridylate synthase RsuA-like enzyme